MDEARVEPDLISFTVEIVSAFVANNSVKSDEVSRLIRETHGALAGLGNGSAAETSPEPTFTPAVSIRKSLASREHILSLIDGKPYKVLKRHLKGHGLTAAQYRERYDLPKSYPMVAPAFSEARRATALRIGLGNKRRVARSKKAAPPVSPRSERQGARPSHG
jgi:predicted transcriptional regulator